MKYKIKKQGEPMTNTVEMTVKESGLVGNRAQELTARMGEYFRAAKAIEAEAKDIVVTDEDQADKMDEARHFRLKLVKIRTGTEGLRKELKAQSLRESKAIDGAANIIKALIVPIEEHLEKQEQFLILRETARREKILNDRISELQKYVEDTNLYSLKDMADEVFNKLVESSKAAWEAQRAAERQAEQERIDKEKAELAERIKIKAENDRLKKEQEKHEKILAEEKKKVDAIKVEQEAVLKAEREEKENALRVEREKKEKALAEERKKAETEKAKQDAILEKEREKREAIEAKIAREKEEKERAELAEEEQKRKALLAPDKQKLISFANYLDKIEIPNVSSREAGKAIDEAHQMLIKVSDHLRDNAKKL